jgi:hypothetical protein
MKTDIPLKRLTTLRGADLLPLLNLPAATLVSVESRELPTTATRLDTLLRVRSPKGQEYLHVLEWMGYPDYAGQWRVVGYTAWLGQQEPGTVVVGTIVYLTPECEVGDPIPQTIDGEIVQGCTIGRLRMWEQDAQAALASGKLGLVVLSPLMRNADSALVETAAQFVMQQAPREQQDDLLSILGVFAEPLFDPQQFVNLIGREHEVELIGQYETRLRQQEEQFRQQEEQFQHELQQALEDTLLLRFPAAPLAVIRNTRQVKHPAELRRLILEVQQVSDLTAAEQLLREAAERA